MQSKEEFILETTQFLWDNFSKLVTKDPSQWEAVFYAHSYTVQKDQPPIKVNYSENALYTFNSQEYDFYLENGVYYLFNLITSKTIKIPENLFKLLLRLKESRDSFTLLEFGEILERSLLVDLIEKNILSELRAPVGTS